MGTNPQKTQDLFEFTKEILNKKALFLGNFILKNFKLSEIFWSIIFV